MTKRDSKNSRKDCCAMDAISLECATSRVRLLVNFGGGEGDIFLVAANSVSQILTYFQKEASK